MTVHVGGMRRRTRWTSSGSAAQSAATLIAAMTVAPSAARQIQIQGTIQELMNSGAWDRFELLYVLAAHDAQAARLNWKNPAANTLTLVGAPAFVIDRGYTGSGTTKLDTGFNTANSAATGGKYAQDSAHYGFWGNDDSVVSGTAAPVNVASQTLYILPKFDGTNGRLRINSAANLIFPSTSTQAYFIANRHDAGNQMVWRNNVLTSAAGNSGALGAGTLLFLNSTNGLNPYLGQVSAGHAGAALSDSEAQSVYFALRNYNANVGVITDPASLLISNMTQRPPVARQTLIRNLVDALVTAGVWAKLDLLYLFAAHDAQAARLNWKNPALFTATPVGTPAFAVDRGYTGGGTIRLDTGFNPLTAGGGFVQDSAHLGVWPNTAGVAGSAQAIAGGGGFLQIQADATTNRSRINCASSISGSTTSAIAHHISLRRDAANQHFWRNGVLQTAAQASIAVATGNVFILNGGNGAVPFIGEVSLAHAGAGLTDPEITSLNSALATYRRGVGLPENETAILVNSMTVPPDAARQTLINNLIVALKDGGIWTKLDLLYLFAAHDEQAARVNWKNPALYALAHSGGTCAFQTDRGFTGGGTARLDTGFNPVTAGGQYTQDSAHMGAWGNTEVTPGLATTWVSNSGANFLNAQNTSTTSVMRINTAGSTNLNIPSTSSIAHMIAVRRDAANQWYWRNGVTGSGPHASGAMTSFNMYIMNFTNGLQPALGQVSLAHVGGGLTDPEMTALNSALATYRRGVGLPEPETAILVNSMTVPPDAARQTLINNLIIALKDGGVWSKLDVLYLLAAHDAQAARLNWKNPATFACTAINSPTFVVDRGYTGGTSGVRLDTGFNPITAAGQLTQNSAHIGFWGSNEGGVNTGVSIVCGVGSTLYILPQANSTTCNMRANANVTLTIPSTSTIAHFIALRRTSTDYINWRNGVQTTLANTSVAVSSANLSILDRTDGVSPYLGQVGVAHAGGALSDADMTTLSAALATYRTGVGL